MRKISLIIAALALVLGLSQCKKENKPAASGETQRIVLTASNGNDGSKVDVGVNEATKMLDLTWESTDEIAVSDGLVGTLEFKDGEGQGTATFEGTVTRKEGDNVTFTVGAAPASFEGQTGDVAWIKSHMHLVGTDVYKEEGSYTDVNMQLQYAVLKLDLSALGTASGNVVTIKAGDNTVATVTGVTDDANKVYYVAMPAAASKTYTFSGNGMNVAKTWTLANNIFYTGNTSGAAIVIKPALFSVGPNTTVVFSPGNLQYNLNSGTWRFAPNQWDVLETNEMTIGTDYASYTANDGWIGLFGWGSTGTPSDDSYYQHYQPWSTDQSSTGHSSDYNSYGYGPSTNRDHPTGGEDQCNLLVSNGSDWGANAISNGGNVAGKWRTLTGGDSGEWNYLLEQRAMTNDKPRYTEKVAGVSIAGTTYKGLFIYPDDYNGTEVGADATTDTWDKINALGIVFLPAAGYRNGTAVNSVGSRSYYWSSSYYRYNYNYAFCLYFYDNNVKPKNFGLRCLGCSVRLVSEN